MGRAGGEGVINYMQIWRDYFLRLAWKMLILSDEHHGNDIYIYRYTVTVHSVMDRAAKQRSGMTDSLHFLMLRQCPECSMAPLWVRWVRGGTKRDPDRLVTACCIYRVHWIRTQHQLTLTETTVLPVTTCALNQNTTPTYTDWDISAASNDLCTESEENTNTAIMHSRRWLVRCRRTQHKHRVRQCTQWHHVH